MTEHSEFRLRMLDDNTVRIDVGAEHAQLTAHDVTRLIAGLIAARDLMEPETLPADPQAEAVTISSTKGLRLNLWPEVSDQGGVSVGVGVSGLGWIRGHVSIEDARAFQQKLAVAIHDPDQTKQ
ncbi:MAG: hypothetical protein ACTIDN_00185 [Acetobacter sp.]|uniref:hypothetical protein n=1 Tax=Acetobacter sp. TaxID=440 RepID=UPI003F8DFAAE